MRIHHNLCYGECYFEDQQILLCNFSFHPPGEALHCGVDVWETLVGFLSAVEVLALMICSAAWRSLLPCVECKGPYWNLFYGNCGYRWNLLCKFQYPAVEALHFDADL
jgi:hypothetical protein